MARRLHLPQEPFVQHSGVLRRRIVAVGDLQLVVAAAEDILIAKLEWAKMGESERQIDDAAAIIRVQRTSLDTAYVERWVRELDLTAQWEAARKRST